MSKSPAPFEHEGVVNAAGARLPLIFVENLLVIIDQGQALPSDYVVIETVARERARTSPSGIGCLVIIPSTARPPQEDVRSAIKAALDNFAPRLLGLCWLVEGSGFRAATVRAALAGLGLFVRAPYPTSVQKDLTEAVHWLLQHSSRHAHPTNIRDAVASIERARASFAIGAGRET